MSSYGPSSRGRRIALCVGGALAAAVVAAPNASAAFSLAGCGGALAPGRGASFQTTAFTGFKGVFAQEPPVGCGSAAANLVTWDPAGSGAGRRALGEQATPQNPTGDRDLTIRWAGSDEPPTQVQRQQMQNGSVLNGVDVTAADNGQLHVIPVAIGAIAALVHLPTGCVSFGNDTILERPKVRLSDFEHVWYGEQFHWGDLIPGLLPADASCRDAAITRVVRRDSSGTTFAFKQLMTQINPAHTQWGTLANQSWPNNLTAPVSVPNTDTGRPLADLVRDTPGTIGYVDLATARATSGSPFTYASGGFDPMFWLPMQRSKGNTDLYDDPQADANGYKDGATARGAACTGVQPRNVPAAPVADPSLGDWSAVDSTLTGTGYAACTLTYDLAFDDNAVVYCNSAQEEAIARTIKDYFTRAVVSTAGQASLPGSDYDALPASVLGIAQTAVAQIGWNKGGQGRPCPGAVTPPPPPPPSGGGGTTPTPPPTAPSNAVTIASARVRGTTIRLSLQLPGPGKLSVASTTKPKRGKTISLATKRVSVTRSGAQTVTVSLSSKAKSALRRDKRLKFTLKISYTPTGGALKTVTKTITVKQPKKSKK